MWLLLSNSYLCLKSRVWTFVSVQCLIDRWVGGASGHIYPTNVMRSHVFLTPLNAVSASDRLTRVFSAECSWSDHLTLNGVSEIQCWLCVCACVCRGSTAVDGAGFGVDRPAELTKSDDEYDAFRKRMMLAYRFRPNPLVSLSRTHYSSAILVCLHMM